jgi:hypothetical protein
MISKIGKNLFLILLKNNLINVSFTSAMLNKVIPAPKEVPLKNSVVFDLLKQK